MKNSRSDIDSILKVMMSFIDKPKKIIKYYPDKIIEGSNIRVVYSQGSPINAMAPCDDILQYRSRCKVLKNIPNKMNNVYKNYLYHDAVILSELWMYESKLLEEFSFKINNINYVAAFTNIKLNNIVRINSYLTSDEDMVLSKFQVSINSPYLSITEYEYNSENNPTIVNHSDIYLSNHSVASNWQATFKYDKNGTISDILHSSGKYFLKQGVVTKIKI
jgi:hypothetical protein